MRTSSVLNSLSNNVSKRIFISDIHASAGWGLNPEPNKHVYEWFTESDCARFVKFIDVVKIADEYDELVLLGDIFDNWNFPYDIKPPTMNDLMDIGTAKKVITVLNDLASMNFMSSAVSPVPKYRTKVFYNKGNHDLTMTEALVNYYMPNVQFIGDNKFVNGRLQAEHGNEYCLFCSPDDSKSDRLPLGYFISRIVMAVDRDKGTHSMSIRDIISEVVKVLEHKENVVLAVFDAVCQKAGVSDTSEILMPDDIWGGNKIKVQEIKDMYKSLYSEYEKKHGEIMAALSIPAELSDLGLVASDLFIRGGVNAIIMGHTHAPVLHEVTVPIAGHLAYINSGCWCNNTPKATWVEAVKDDTGSTYTLNGCTGLDSNGELLTTHIGKVEL